MTLQINFSLMHVRLKKKKGQSTVKNLHNDTALHGYSSWSPFVFRVQVKNTLHSIQQQELTDETRQFKNLEKTKLCDYTRDLQPEEPEQKVVLYCT